MIECHDDPKPGMALRMFELSYDELRRIAHRLRLAGHRADESQIRAIVHETYIRFCRRLHGLALDPPPERQVFMRVVTLMMRSVAIDRWRRRHALRRGGGKITSLSEREPAAAACGQALDPTAMLALDAALDALRTTHPECFAVIVERDLRGRSRLETAAHLGIAADEVRRRRRQGLASLRRSLEASAR
jgi:DNA-directed RNA polymerase specialized sigma24 family protein